MGTKRVIRLQNDLDDYIIDARKEKMKTYDSITKLQPTDVLVFGSNLLGRHDCGDAGYVSGGVCAAGYGGLPDGAACWRNVKGCARGLQRGAEGLSYALPTCTADGQGLPPCAIVRNIRDLYGCMLAFGGLSFMTLYTASGPRPECGLSAEHMAQLFADAADPHMPPNAVFERGFAHMIEERMK